MLIEKKDREDHLEKGYFLGEPDIIEASELLYGILDASYTCSGTCLKMEINGKKEDIRSLYWRCKELMEQIAKGGRKIGFLAMSVLEQTFEQALPLLLAKVEDIARGDNSQVEAVLKLKQIFRENPYKELWLKKSGKYRELIEKFGFSVQTADYADLTAIMDPLLDAFTFYAGKNNRISPVIHKVREGKRSVKRPETSLSVSKYSSEKELVDAVARCGKESVIAFGAVEKTNRQMDDGFCKWYYGRPDERQHNFMYHDHITEEEYLNQICGYSRCVYLCVKAGQAIWLVRMPYDKDSYSGDEYGPEGKYYYGRRAGYAPYEVFYKEPPAAEKDTTFLSVHRKGFLLSELMDEQQKIWFPVFIEETIEKFFSREEPEADIWFLPEESIAAISKNEDRTVPGKNCIVPVASGLPSVPRYVHKIRKPEEIFQGKEMQTLLKYFHITEQDILNAPVLPAKCGTRDEIAKHINEGIRKAYAKVLAEKIADFLEGKWNVREMVLNRIETNWDRIFKQAAVGKFNSFMYVVVDGTREEGKDGKVSGIIHTTMEDCRENRYVYSWQPKIFWKGDTLSGKAPVVWKIRPIDTAGYAALLDMKEEELPDILKLSSALRWFYEKYKHELPDNLTNKYVWEQSMENRSIYFPQFADVNICMGKKIYNKYRKTTEGARE